MTPEEIYAHFGEALVFIGAGGPAEDWERGIAKMLHDDGVTDETKPSKIWKVSISRIIQNERTDLILPFTSALKLEQLAIWRVRNRAQFGVMWLSDYINNSQQWGA